jgi:hypothetical protein
LPLLRGPPTSPLLPCWGGSPRLLFRSRRCRATTSISAIGSALPAHYPISFLNATKLWFTRQLRPRSSRKSQKGSRLSSRICYRLDGSPLRKVSVRGALGAQRFKLFLSLREKIGCPILSRKLAVGFSASGKGWETKSARA